jgi:TolB-like protein/DNA-binding SARP family transcriptional activator/Tfp pilus assembly protein PilF
MYRLRLFGGLALEENAGVHTGKAAQRRRLAVLALLETAPRRTLTRDKLIALLWADEDAEHARHRLSVVLHELRKVLGDDAIRSLGDDISLDPEALKSDVAEFSTALAAGELERATSLYDGPFLDGVFLSGAPEFEHWVDSERDRWERSYRSALERLAEEAEGRSEWSAAADVWRKLTMADRLNSRIAVRYMNALAYAGEGAAALQFAHVHELLLREELGAEPPAELRAAIERVEQGTLQAQLMRAPSPLTPPAPQPAERAELTPAAPPPPAQPAPRSHARLRRGQRSVAIRSVVITLAALLIAGFIVRRFGGNSSAKTGADRGTVVAVLPFVNLSDNDSNQHLSDGLTEEMISALGRVPGLVVPSRTTMFAYKERRVAARTAARELSADYMMEGSVRRAGDQLRITVRVLNSNGMQVWTRDYDRTMEGIFTVQQEITGAAVDALQSRLDQQLARPALRYTTRDPEAYDLYLQGRAAWYSRSPDGLMSALRYFKQAVARDSTYALAYSGIADVYNMFGAYHYSVVPPREAYPQARAAAARALQLDPELAEAHAALGSYLYNYEWKWAEAERELRRAIALNPGYSMAHHWLELVLLISGQSAEALEVIRAAREQDPRSPLISSALAHHYYYIREFSEARREFQHALDLDSTFLVARLGLGMTYMAIGEHEQALAQVSAARRIAGEVPVTQAVLAYTLASSGREQEARALLADLERKQREGYIGAHFFALVYLALGDEERALAALEAALAERSGAMLYLLLEPPLEVLYDQPRFQALVQRVHGRNPPTLPAGRKG